MICPLVSLGDVRLQQVSLPVTEKEFSHVPSWVRNMFDTMYDALGIGLAAVQIGMMKRIFVMDLEKEDPQSFVFVNPVLKQASLDKIETTEGCLSIPDLKLPVERHRAVLLEYQTLDKQKKTLEATDLEAICIQHEIDHLNGVLFLDRVVKKYRKDVKALYPNYVFTTRLTGVR